MYKDKTFVERTMPMLKELVFCYASEHVDKEYYNKIREHSYSMAINSGQDPSKVTLSSNAGGLNFFEIGIALGNKLGGVKQQDMQVLFERLIEKKIIIQGSTMLGGFDGLITTLGLAAVRYKLSNLGIITYLQGLMENTVYGFPYIIEKYRKSIVQVLGVDRLGDQTIGTGFIVKSGVTKKIITCKHNIEGMTEIKFVSDTEVIGYNKINLIPDIDCAVIDIEPPLEKIEGFKLYFEAEPLTEVITMGFPKIPQSGDAYLMIHKGEINGLIRDYEGKNDYIIFSAKTSSGNSGSPLISEFGVVLGMVTNELFDQSAYMNQGKPPYYAAIPSSVISNSSNLSSILDLYDIDALSSLMKNATQKNTSA